MSKFIDILKNIYDKVADFGSMLVAKLGSDGLLHAYFSTIITVVSLWLLGFFGLFIPVAIGIFKECMDMFVTGDFSIKDLIADGIGIVVGIILSIL